ncbi:hypothetical protein NDU88_001657 [Pleurodeles waltl]|uniref:Uncharacterized protein n=1 Tax=Pleurodeles waltl TaxID=8319 RepID=A0AAV7MNB2_PLEWA|nr:hypothetical protein NDU88_001657 [Pleurodeles waltl]
MEQYTTSTPLLQRQTRMGRSGETLGVPATVKELSHAKVLAAIQGARGKIEMVAVEIKLLRADLRMVSDKVKVVEGSIEDLQMEVGTLRIQMAQVTSTVGTLEVKLED